MTRLIALQAAAEGTVQHARQERLARMPALTRQGFRQQFVIGQGIGYAIGLNNFTGLQESRSQVRSRHLQIALAS